ncbi:LURP-one-related family protein [Thalassotalea psychrophila]|uniref:LURP-one-related family protein n=1 Tax=Thalassotalea psychrophila TaxID=3065647 RepID=A0ABY9TRW6_9GAMM|nr:LURP-one-related family protein [Colwelliaceae bacterium SQ149]
MAKFQLKQRFLSLTEKFEIKNEQDEIVYFVDGKFFSIGKTFHLKDSNANELAEIKQKVISLRPTFYINFKNGQQAKVVKTFLPIFKSRFAIKFEGREITATGNFLSHEYQFSEAGVAVAEVSKKWFSFSDTYGLNVENDELNELALCILIVIDAVHHGSDNNSS